MESSQKDLLDSENLQVIIRRRKLLPWWIKIFIWIFLLLGAIVPVAITFGILGKDIQISLYGLSTNEPFTITGIFIILIFAFKAFIAFSLWFEKRWAVRFGIIDAYTGICICLLVFIYNLLKPSSIASFPIEIIFLALYLVWLHKIHQIWSIN
jgi:hypothetical protein